MGRTTGGGAWCALGALLGTAALPHAALADECRLMIARLVAEVPGLTYKTGTMHVRLDYPGVRKVILDCPPDQLPSLTVSWEGIYPPSSFFDFVAKAGAVVSNSTPANVRAGAVRCHQLELSKKESYQSEVLADGVLIECMAGSTPVTFIMVYGGRWSIDPKASTQPKTKPPAGNILPGPGVTGRDALGK